MPVYEQLQRDFFSRSALIVARELLGARLVRREGVQRLAGLIVETEAYSGVEDLGCHCRAGLTPRTRVLYGMPGRAYVYFTYGMHWMLNLVVEREGYPAAILIRAILPTEGMDIIAVRRGGQAPQHWTDGPGKICQALNIDKRHHDSDLCALDAEVFVEKGTPIPDSSVTTGPRVGLNSVPEPWKSVPWRFRVRESSVAGGEWRI
jgi:DNA-3-methyladenine glycosylase